MYILLPSNPKTTSKGSMEQLTECTYTHEKTSTVPLMSSSHVQHNTYPIRWHLHHLKKIKKKENPLSNSCTVVKQGKGFK